VHSKTNNCNEGITINSSTDVKAARTLAFSKDGWKRRPGERREKLREAKTANYELSGYQRQPSTGTSRSPPVAARHRETATARNHQTLLCPQQR